MTLPVSRLCKFKNPFKKEAPQPAKAPVVVRQLPPGFDARKPIAGKSRNELGAQAGTTIEDVFTPATSALAPHKPIAASAQKTLTSAIAKPKPTNPEGGSKAKSVTFASHVQHPRFIEMEGGEKLRLPDELKQLIDGKNTAKEYSKRSSVTFNKS